MDDTGQPLCDAALSPDTWDDFARLVEANNWVWGGCWCMGFHPEASARAMPFLGTVWPSKPAFATERFTRFLFTTAMNASAGASTARRPSYRTSRTRKPMPRAWARGPTGGSVASSLEAGTGAVGLRGRLWAPRWPPSRCRRWARRGLPRVVEGRAAQRGAYFHTGSADLFEEFGFERDRMIAKWRWVMRLRG
jgi:hypothetical protein